MLKFGLFLSVLLMLQTSRCCANSDEIQDDDEESQVARSHEVVDSFPRSYNAAQYPWRLWNFPYYQPRTPQMPFGDGERSPPLADPRFVTNRCSHRQSYYPTTTYACYTTYVTVTVATLTTTTTVTTTVYPTTTTYPTTDTTTDTTTPTSTSTSTTPSTTPAYTSTTPQMAG